MAKRTPEEIAAAKTAKENRIKSNAEKIKKGGDGAMLATIDNVVSDLEEKIAALGEGEESVRGELTEMKANLEKMSRETKKRKEGSRTSGLETSEFKFSKIGKIFATSKAFANEDNTKGIGLELEALVEAAKSYGMNYEKKDIISSLTGGSGGFPLPVEIKQEIIAAARSKSALFDMGITSESLEGMSAFSVPIETTSTGGTGDGVIMQANPAQEGGALTLTRNGYKLANFTPRKLMMGIGITNDLLRQGGNFVEEFVRKYAAVDFKNQIERNALNGGGQTRGQPTGLLNRTDLTQFTGIEARPITSDGRPAVFQDFKDFEFDLMIANRFTDDAKFLTHPGVMRGPSQQYTTLAAGGTPYPTFPAIQMASIKKLVELMGFDIRQTTNMGYQPTGTTATTSAIAYGDWENMWIPFWGPMEFLMTNIATVAGVSAFENDMSYMRFVQMYDVNIVAPDSMMVQKGFQTVGF